MHKNHVLGRNFNISMFQHTGSNEIYFYLITTIANLLQVRIIQNKSKNGMCL